MGDRFTIKEDEQDVDFGDTRLFTFTRWEEAVLAARQALSSADWEKVMETRDWQNLQTDIRQQGANPKVLPPIRRLLGYMAPFPRTLATFIGEFTRSLNPFEGDFTLIWGLVDLNIKLSIDSMEKLSRTAGWVKRLRGVIELFNRCLSVCDDFNEARYAMVDVLEWMLQILVESVKHLRLCRTDGEAQKAWKGLEAKINENLASMEASVKQLNEINNYSRANQERQVKNLSLRHAPIVVPEEPATFPISLLPRNPNENFYGRQEELKKIDHYLDPKTNANLRTYTIYGRRGVGKTDLALQYADTNPSRFDAIFWVNCETSLSLRQSFTDIAVKINLPGADRNGHHEENQLAVQKWLKITKGRWLLIFDNAERESILQGYWPLGASGAILITSRKYYNFMNDAQRQGDTVKPFNEKQSRDLLMKLLGPDWQDMDRKGLIKGTEEAAARALLKELGGLALAIQQAAELIRNPNIGGSTVESMYESFKEHKKTLPPRQAGERSTIVHALDSLWHMTFTHLTPNARDLLSVLSLLSPDGILIDLFLPKNQEALDGKLQFCKQHPNHVDPKSQATLSSVITAPPLLRAAIEELAKFKLIKQESRELWAHRVVQEAMNYHTSQDLQAYFDSACALVYEAFPKQVYGEYLSNQQGACQTYIPHGAHLILQFANLHRAGTADTLIGSSKFINLVTNCAWYLYEVSDYDMCIRLVDTARIACEDKESLAYASICNAAGGSYYELNQLGECRKNWEIFLQIQESKLEPNSLELSSSFHNMGNLESASDNLVDAMEYFNKAIAIRVNSGDTAAGLLANSYLCQSRVHFLQEEYETAFNLLAKSEALFVRTAGAGAHFMAHVHYAYGNIDFAQKKWVAAKRSYETSLRIGLATAPIHPVTAAAYYSLGCVEFEQENNENAKSWLDKAMAIAQLRSPKRDDGTMARIMWKTSKVLEADTFGTYQAEATALYIRADTALKSLTARGEGGVVIALDEEGNADPVEEENSYDALVPGYFR